MASPVSEIERANDVPEKIGKYVIINKIGKGSTGQVYLSHDPYYRRDVAIKVYRLEEDSDADRAQRLSQDVLQRSAHGRHAAASEHHADLRRRRGRRVSTTS